MKLRMLLTAEDIPGCTGSQAAMGAFILITNDGMMAVIGQFVLAYISYYFICFPAPHVSENPDY